MRKNICLAIEFFTPVKVLHHSRVNENDSLVLRVLSMYDTRVDGFLMDHVTERKGFGSVSNKAQSREGVQI